MEMTPKGPSSTRSTILQQNITARCYYFWSGIKKLVTATDTAIVLYMWRPAGRKTSVGTLINGQLNVVHVHDEVSVLSDVALHSLSKGKGRPVTFITVYRCKDNKEGALPLRTRPLQLRKLLLLLMLLLLFGCCLLLLFLLLAVEVVVLVVVFCVVGTV